MMYEKEGKLDEAYQASLSEAEKGSAEAMFFIGNLYFFSEYEAESDGGRAAILDAILLRGGMMLPWDMKEKKVPNYAKALEWYLEAAKADWVPAMVSAACMIHIGQGGPQDDETARFLLEEAAKTGDPRAIGALRDFFGVTASPAYSMVAYSMTEYREMLRDFENETANIQDLYYRLLLGSPLQLYKLGYVLAKLHCSKSGFEKNFPFAVRSDKRPYAPIDHWRFDYGSTFVVNLDAFDDPEFTLS